MYFSTTCAEPQPEPQPEPEERSSIDEHGGGSSESAAPMAAAAALSIGDSLSSVSVGRGKSIALDTLIRMSDETIDSMPVAWMRKVFDKLGLPKAKRRSDMVIGLKDIRNRSKRARSSE